ncbi:HMA2 domain-containing protein [Campylobacter sp. RM15925]|uniref:HMA2 domain-containing protein n=1 Tax=Campylobacter TaxID=194 RepID=UPI0014762CCA|nr:hypothetical protein [Campylobacter sp. RM15925]
MTATPNLVATDMILKIASYFTPIHHTAGRLRVRVSSKIKDEAQNLDISKIDEMINSIDGIKSVKFNKLIGSVTIEYDKEVFAKEIWDDLLAGRNMDQISIRINELARNIYAK